MNFVTILLVLGLAFGLWKLCANYFSEESILERRAEKRRDDAEKKQILKKAVFILDELGQNGYPHESYEDNVIRILRRCSEERYEGRCKDTSVRILPAGRTDVVFEWSEWNDFRSGSSGSGVSAYIPEEWENHLDALYSESRKAKPAKDKDAHTQSLKKRFGL